MSSALIDQHWDVVVIGTGMGGGTVGRALAEAGKKVLFIELGSAGHRSETNGLSETILPAARLARGLWPYPMNLTLNGRESTAFAPLGAGIGGSSVFYAATLERPERHDLEATAAMPHPTGGWPVGFDEMAPWYDRASAQYCVYGGVDPLSVETPCAMSDPPEFNQTENALVHGFQGVGLHPYHAHTAMAQGAAHDDCLGRKCAKENCKMDGRSAGVEPALKTGNAFVLTMAKVARLLGTKEAITAAEVLHDGQRVQVTADKFFLSAGALGSPRILLASACEDWPDGASNDTGLVGRNLMFHLNELYAIWPKGGNVTDGSTKAISLRDFYAQAGQRLGTFQAMGIRASYGEIHHFLSLMAQRSAISKLPAYRHLLRLPAAVAAKSLGAAQIFVGLLEDLPYTENRVEYDPADPDALRVHYRHHDELLDRRKAFRRAIWKRTKGMRRAPLSLQPELNLGHPSGTLRFGEDAKTSVLNAHCQSHAIRNLWVADASFMPTSMGVNPSLTIAANALRVADHVINSAAGS